MAFDLSRAVHFTSEGKALVAHPAFMGKEPVATYQPGKPSKDSVISQRTAGRHSSAFGGSEAIDHVYDCVNLYVDAVASAPYRLERLDGTKLYEIKKQGTPPDHEKGSPAAYALLKAPNPAMGYNELVSLLVIDLLLVGNAYWFKWNKGTPAMAIYRLAPSHVKIVPGPYGPLRYEYQPPGRKEVLEIAAEDLVHFRRPNPHSSYYGMGVIQGAGRSMDLELALTDTVTSYYENKADPSMIIQSERRVPRDVFNKLRAQLRARSSGSRNAGELLVLEAGLKASSLSVSASDGLFEQLGKMSRDRVYSKFRASPMLFGLLDEATGGNKISDARREFDNYALRPFMWKLQEQITAALTLPDFGVNFIIDHRQILPAEDAIKVAELVATVPGVKVREVRRQLAQFGIEESTGDSTIDEFVLNRPQEELGEDGQPVDPTKVSGADQPIGSEPGRPPKIENTAGFAKGQKGIDAILADLSLAALLEGKAGPVSTPAPDNRLPGEKRPSDSFSSARDTDITATAEFIAEGLREASAELERGLLDTVEGKALKTGDIVSKIKRSPAWAKFKKRIEGLLEEAALRAASSGVMHSGLTPDDDIDYDGLVKSVVHRPEGIRGILGTLKERVARRVKDTRDADGERAEYEAAIREVTAEWSESQVLSIAETEAVHAYNEGTLTAAEMSGVQAVYVTDGDDHDEPCVEANGSVWDIATARSNRLEHPRCRRAFLPLGAVA